ncbi:hypothetical protein SRHO_G00187430 [Serrasalmus rhombeus]
MSPALPCTCYTRWRKADGSRQSEYRHYINPQLSVAADSIAFSLMPHSCGDGWNGRVRSRRRRAGSRLQPRPSEQRSPRLFTDDSAALPTSCRVDDAAVVSLVSEERPGSAQAVDLEFLSTDQLHRGHWTLAESLATRWARQALVSSLRSFNMRTS